jgi:RNA polymerase sigma factor (TIGR02999 family)
MPDSTEELNAAAAGDMGAASRIAERVYGELRRLAAHYMRRERSDHTLQTTALAHEAYLRMFDQDRVDWNSRTHYLGVAAEMIRRVLVDHARKRLALKRGPGICHVTVDDRLLAAPENEPLDILTLEAALNELAKMSPRQARVVELRFFAGLGVEETATAMGVSERTVKGDWRVARAWLRRYLSK